MRTLLRDRSYRRLLIGQTLSALGDYAMFLALAVWVKALTGSSAKAGLAILPFVLPTLIGPALGVYVDRFPRRRTMIITDLAAAASVLPLLAVNDAADIWLIYLASFLIGLCTVVYQAARAGLIVSMLPEDQLGEANGLLQSTSQAMRLFAPLAGAALFAVVGGPAVALLDAVTFLVSAAFLLGVHAPAIERADEESGFWPELKAGVRHIVRTSDLRRLTIGTAIVTLAAGVMEVVIFDLIDDGLHRAPEFLGVLSTVEGAGAVIGGVLVGRALRKIGELPTIAWALVAAGIGVGLLATAQIAVVFVGIATVGIAVSLYNVAFITLIQRRTDAAMQGRVMSAVEAAFTVPFAISIAIGAAIVTVVSFRTVYLLEAAAFGGVAVYLAIAARADDGAVPGAVAAEPATPPIPSTPRTRRREQARSSWLGARGRAARPPRSLALRPTL
jgi:MFS family permease